MTQSDVVVGVIGGSGLYEMDGLEDVREVSLATPFGAPSDAYITGTFAGVSMAFLPRHGRGHRISPSELNFRANIWGLKKLGATHIVSVSAVGSMREDIVPGEFVVIDQFFDRTRHRPDTFFSDGIVAHVLFADPVCPDLRLLMLEACREAGIKAHDGGTYLNMEGPQFSTRAESKIYRQWGVDVIGMTNLQEAKLAREAEMSYATLAMATDYDCWHEGHDDVTVEAVLEVAHRNVGNARAVVKAVVPKIAAGPPSRFANALEHAIMTSKEHISPEVRERLGLLIDKYLD
ncbi:S-methyl-5'-thioadenosine phosphorylase [Engelhardtia mirabilis]|uniref:S-methyl-5'-thioadenosine phosphorylase n=1 Tax=Engelhardtia mirabilis TaxID=2528011 RepID=A0A518BJ05_9BACT|nr:S-methyl-5'-thioadenosine phosphorylase [Planctomycetes bacterium Pla133]QDV01272.1 S-methyl-5'-thioadenosine phosphorylase [Planctomycetes bacterium Pla86]